MRARTALTATVLLLAAGPACAADSEVQRYRGDYTLGHEVNVFCPAINSQCYWLSPETPNGIRSMLRQLSADSQSNPYDPVCVIIEANIDRDSPRTGFAADYDGQITVSQVYGICAEVSIVTQGDLQHHRWVLEAINGQAWRPPEPGALRPELDFGERMRVSGNAGCNGFSGAGVLRGEYFLVEALIQTRRLCGPSLDERELLLLTVLGSESRIRLHPDKALILESPTAVLRFRLRDWVS